MRSPLLITTQPDLLILAEADEDLPEDLAAKQNDRANELQALLTKTRETVAGIINNRELVVQERGRRVAEVLNNVSEFLTTNARRLAGDDLYEFAVGLEHNMLLPGPRLKISESVMKPERVAALERETRDLLRPLESLDRVVRLKEAAMADDRLTLRAYEYAPPAFQLVSDVDLRAAAHVHASVRFPDQYLQLQATWDTWDYVSGNFTTGLHQFNEVGGGFGGAARPTFHRMIISPVPNSDRAMLDPNWKDAALAEIASGEQTLDVTS